MSLFRKKAKKKSAEKHIDPYWKETYWGYVPAYLTKDKTGGGSHGRNSSTRAHSFAQTLIGNVGYAIREYKSVKEKEFSEVPMTTLLKAICGRCNKTWLVPEERELLYFSCPICTAPEDYELLKILFYEKKDGTAFHKCPSCNRYAEISISHHPERFEFECGKCKSKYTLDRNDPLILEQYSDAGGFFACGACGRIFVSVMNNQEAVFCPRCGSYGDPK